MNAMQKMTEGMIKENQPKFEVGDTVRVSVRIKEGDKERIQAFEGTVIAKKHGGIAETFTDSMTIRCFWHRSAIWKFWTLSAVMIRCSRRTRKLSAPCSRRQSG